MEKQTKQIITKDGIEKELRFYNKANIRSTLVLYGILSLLLIPIAVLLIFEIRSLTDSLLWEIVFCTFFSLLVISPLALGFSSLYRGLAERKLINQGAFDVLTREVSYKSEEYIRRRCVEQLHFVGFQAVEAGHTIFQLTSEGDTFYLVVYRTEKPAIKLFYPAKIYEYRELRV